MNASLGRTIGGAIRLAENSLPSSTWNTRFPLYQELLGAVFVDAGNLLPDAHFARAG